MERAMILLGVYQAKKIKEHGGGFSKKEAASRNSPE